MNKNKGIYIKINDCEISIPIYDKITVITGDSATGKTKMINFIKACLNSVRNQAEIETSINLDDIIIIDDKYTMESVIKNDEKKKIIFIDRFNILVDKNILQFIQKSQNIFILIGHRNLSELTMQDAVLIMKHDGHSYRCSQLYEHGILNPAEKV